MSDVPQDVVVAIRQLRKAPAFALAAVLTLALGVGVNTAVFSIVNAVTLRPLPVRDGERLVVLARQDPSDALRGVSAPDFAPYRDLTASAFEDIAGYDVGFLTLAPEGERAVRVLVTWVTGDYFPLLGVAPALGRVIQREDVTAGRASPLAVLGYAAWQKRFAGDPGIIGRRIRVNGRPITVVGVAPPEFHGTFAFTDAELYLPLTWEQGWPKLSAQHAIARLRAGASVEEGQAAIDLAVQRMAEDSPDEYANVQLTVVPERLARPEEEFARWNLLASRITLVLVALVLAVAAINVTNLLLARGLDRRRELAIRAAVGASRGRLVRLLLTEASILALLGGALGVVLARWTAQALATITLPGDKPIHLDFALDTRVLAYAAASALVTALAVGLAPAFRASRVDLQDALRDGARRAAARVDGWQLRNLLIAGQIAACFVLLFTAALFARSLSAAERIELGFRPAGVLNVTMDVQQLAYDEARGREFFARVDRDVRSIPGVRGVAMAFVVPLGYIWHREPLYLPGDVTSSGDRPLAGVNWVSHDYFRTLGVPVIAGRTFTEDDRAGVAVVNRRLAELLWPGENPVGRLFTTRGPEGPWQEVIGITATGKYDFVFENPQPYVYFPLDQWATGASERTLHVLASGSAERLIPAVERVIRQLESEIVLFDVMTMERSLGGGFGFFLVRTAAFFAMILGALALSLAVVGLYGVVSYAVRQRTHEIGVRVALGAADGDVVRLVLGSGGTAIAIGILTGASIALFLSGVIERFLFGIPARDPVTFLTVGPLLAAVALVACAAPARRALRVDPVDALREA